MIVITNFYNQPQNIVLSQYGGTGNTNCALVNNSSICAGSSKTITVSNTTTLTNISYSIQPGGITNLTGTFVVTPLAKTSYTTYLTGLNGQNNPVTYMAYVNVTVNPQPFSNAGNDVAFCSGVSASIGNTLTPSYSYSWTPSAGLSNSTISNPTVTLINIGTAPLTNTYIVTSDLNGCTTLDA
ncbi:MAG: hypothetical protein ACK50L_07255, partial [Bacteroidota bacterium]